MNLVRTETSILPVAPLDGDAGFSALLGFKDDADFAIRMQQLIDARVSSLLAMFAASSTTEKAQAAAADAEAKRVKGEIAAYMEGRLVELLACQSIASTYSLFGRLDGKRA